jgi:hypothetical protein
MDSALEAGKDKPPIFQPSQIVYLEHVFLNIEPRATRARLYAEVVQFVESRRQCWVRPLALVIQVEDSFIDWMDFEALEAASRDHRLTLHDLREGSDLMCPAILFQQALDTDVIPLLSWLYSLDTNLNAKAQAKPSSQKLHQFIRQIWQARPDAFSNEHLQ